MEFRPLRRFKQAATPQECEAVLSSALILEITIDHMSGKHVREK
jgi:hypothetical protein